MNRAWVLGLLGVTLLVAGCKNKTAPPPTEPAVTPGQMGLTPIPPAPPDLPPPPPPGPTGIGTTLPPPQPMPTPDGAARVHVVKAQETLWKISGIYYGKSSQANVKKIMAANPEIKNDNDIKVGQRIVIPN